MELYKQEMELLPSSAKLKLQLAELALFPLSPTIQPTTQPTTQPSNQPPNKVYFDKEQPLPYIQLSLAS